LALGGSDSRGHDSALGDFGDLAVQARGLK
jgi:hypothetical protein